MGMLFLTYSLPSPKGVTIVKYLDLKSSKKMSMMKSWKIYITPSFMGEFIPCNSYPCTICGTI